MDDEQLAAAAAEATIFAPHLPRTVATLAVVATGVVLPFSPLAGALGFRPVPMAFLAVLIGLAVAYLLLVEVTKRYFFATLSEHVPRRHRAATHRLHRRAGRFSHAGPLRRS